MSIIRAVNAIGVDLNMTVVAEGVETAQQLSTLRALGVSGAQGYYFSRPAPAQDIGVMLLKEIADAAGGGAQPEQKKTGLNHNEKTRPQGPG